MMDFLPLGYGLSPGGVILLCVTEARLSTTGHTHKHVFELDEMCSGLSGLGKRGKRGGDEVSQREV